MHLTPSYQEEKTLIYLVKVARKLKEGPKTSSELKSELKISAKSLYRVLSCLEAIGVVSEGVDGKYRFEGWQVFLDEEQYGVKLDHSRKLLRPYIRKDLTEPIPDAISDEALHDRNIVQHLESGYPEIYIYHVKWLKREEALIRLWELMGKQAANAGFEMIFSKAKAGNLIDVVRAYIERKDFERMKIVCKEGQVWDDYTGMALANEGKYIKEIEELLRSLISSEEVQKAVTDLKNAEEDYDDCYYDFKWKLVQLALKVEHGEPLKGYCDLCPRIVIERK